MGEFNQELTDAEKYLQMGVNLKRQRKYTKAIKAYRMSIKLDSSNSIAYYSLAKTLYLVRQSRESVRNYLAAIHLSLNNMISILTSNPSNVFSAQRAVIEATLDEQILKELRSLHPYADLILLDPETPIHLAHAVIDMDLNIPQSLRALKAIQLYRDALAGDDVLRDFNFDDEVYRNFGHLFVFDNLIWNGIGKSNNVKPYLEFTEFRFNRETRI